MKAPKIVVIGGGTGISTMLRGLKHCSPKITAIVSVADDGGGSGVLRRELGVPPPGDIRNCLHALANAESSIAALLEYRYPKGRLKGQSFGNLFLAALCGISGSFDEAVLKMSDVLAITGRVLPVSNDDVQLKATFENGDVVVGESKISGAKRKNGSGIRRVSLVPEHPKALGASIDAIKAADMIVLGPGSLYTSVIPNLLVEGIAETIAASSALRIYVCNVMNQPGETEGYTAADHIEALFSHSSSGLFDVALVNSGEISEKLKKKYALLGAKPTVIDEDRIKKLGVECICAPLVSEEAELARHDPQLLAEKLMEIYTSMSPTKLYNI